MEGENPLFSFVKGVLTVPLSIIGFVLVIGGLSVFAIHIEGFFWFKIFFSLFSLIIGGGILFILYKAWEKEIKQLFNH